MHRHPSKEKGARDHACDLYDECLDEAVNNGWKTFSCDECLELNEGDPGEPKTEAAEHERKATLLGDHGMTTASPSKPSPRICSDCGLRPTMRPHMGYCAQCMAKRANSKRKAKAVSRPAAAAGHHPSPAPPPASSASGPSDIEKCQEVLKALAGTIANSQGALNVQIVFFMK